MRLVSTLTIDAGRHRLDVLEARADVGREPVADRPVILRVGRVVVDVEHRAADRRVVVEERRAGDEHRNQPAARIEQRRAGGVGREVGVEHVRGGRLRVAAGALAAEPLVAALGLVAAAQLPEFRHAAGELLVVAVLRVGGVEVGRVVDARAVQREERRVGDRRARAAGVEEREVALRVLRLDQQAVAEHPLVVRVEVVVGLAEVLLAARVDDQRLNGRTVGQVGRVVQVAARRVWPCATVPVSFSSKRLFWFCDGTDTPVCGSDCGVFTFW